MADAVTAQMQEHDRELRDEYGKAVSCVRNLDAAARAVNVRRMPVAVDGIERADGKVRSHGLL